MAKILIIDDDRDLVDAMKVVLEADNHQIIEAYSGDEGVRVAKGSGADLIILDLMLEYATKGFDVAKEFKADAELKSVPILMLTAIKEETGVGFSKDVGKEDSLYVDEYLEKPLKPLELMQKVKSMLEKV